MRLGWGRMLLISLCLLMLMVNCAKPKSQWQKWQESLELASPDHIALKIEMQKKTFLEGEPLVCRVLIINRVDVPQIIIHPGVRISSLAGGYQKFVVVAESDSQLYYSPNFLANVVVGPEDAIVLEPCDTLYFNAILCPDLFRNPDRERRKLYPGRYTIQSTVHLGTKWFPLPDRRTLTVTSYPTMFSIDSLPTDERGHLSMIRPYLQNFFGHVEGCLFDPEKPPEEYIDSAIFWLDQVRNTTSYFAQYADFVYTCVPAVTRFHDDTVKLRKSIEDAKEFISKYAGSILAEEIDINVAWWLYWRDSTNVEVTQKDRDVIEKYPRNIMAQDIRNYLRR